MALLSTVIVIVVQQLPQQSIAIMVALVIATASPKAAIGIKHYYLAALQHCW